MFLSSWCTAQHETSKWYFGSNAGLDFMTSPPTVITSGSLNTSEGCASMADANGSLLFYTDGSTIYNNADLVMANGTGLLGFSSSSQSAIIVRQPGSSTIYYVFAQGATSNGFGYSVVDMSLAAGMGSVTTKNVMLSFPSSEKLTSVKHCNGIDTWVITHDYTGNAFRAYLVSPLGVSLTPVTSNVGSSFSGNDYIGCLKCSPNGKRLAQGIYGNTSGYELYDFDASTGIVSSPVFLGPNYLLAYGVEFSPDGTKLYGSTFGGQKVFQWNICAGSAAAIAASTTTLTSLGAGKGQLQLAPNGKIYIARVNQQALAVINNPNTAGASCGYVEVGQTTAPKLNALGLPNFVTSSFRPSPPPFTYTAGAASSCQTASYTAPAIAQSYSATVCSAAAYSVIGCDWDFGDPATGAANSSTLTNPSHVFSTIGTYTTQLVLHYSCGGGTDTLWQAVNITNPCVSVSSTSITCASLISATVTSMGIGPFSYTWVPGNQTTSVVSGLTPGHYTIAVHDAYYNITYSTTANFNSLIPLTGSLLNSSTVACYGATTGTAAIVNIAGGSGDQDYAWSLNGAAVYTTAFVSGLGAGIWSVLVTDALTGCQISETFSITQPPALTLQLSAGNAQACAGTSVVLTGVNSGGTLLGINAGYDYVWDNGSTSSTRTVSESAGGSYVYTLSSSDDNSCTVTNTVAVDFIPIPSLTLSNIYICPQEVGTLSVSGAASYVWFNGATGSTFTDSPIADQQYLVVGSVGGCTASATASIVLKSLPEPTLSSNSPVCSGEQLQLMALGGVSYAWDGPSFISALQDPLINPATPSNSGVYNVTVTAINACTITQSYTVLVNPTPSIGISGATVCVTQTLDLTGSSFAGASYEWDGPNGFNSHLQNPSIAHPSTLASGYYTLSVTSAAGCTNAAMAPALVVAQPQPSYMSNSPRCLGDNLIFNASASSGAASYSWQGPNGFSSSVQNPTLGYVGTAAAGVYTLVTLMGPCSASYAALPVVVNLLPTLTVSALPASVCDGSGAQIVAAGSANQYVWTGPSSFTCSAASSSLSAATFSNAGGYSVTATDAHGCISSGMAQLTVLARPVVSAVGTTVCTNDTAKVNANGADQYLWQGPAGYSSPMQTAVIPTTTAFYAGTYSVTGTAINGCTNTAVAQVGVFALPQPSVHVSAESLCVNDTLTMQGAAGASCHWFGPNGLSLWGSTVKLKVYSMAYTGIYTLTVKDANQCHGSTTQNITVHTLPQLFVNNQLEGCAPFYADISFHVNAASDAIAQMSWSFNGHSYNNSSFGSYLEKPGSYVLSGSFSDVYGCTNTLSDTVYVYDRPKAGFSSWPEKPVENMDQVLFTNTSDAVSGSSWSWSINDVYTGQTHSGNSQNMTWLFSNAGIYPVALVATNAAGCSDTIIKLVEVKPDFHVYVPNTFTPNGDERNELFMPVTYGVSQIDFEVFNRWGEKLYSCNDVSKGWDGTYKGEPCKQDVYVWRVRASDIKGESKLMNGEVSLFR